MSGFVYVDHCIATASRRARRPYQCGTCLGRIAVGDQYLRHKQFPGHDTGWADAAGHPVESPECGDCARLYGRGERLAV